MKHHEFVADQRASTVTAATLHQPLRVERARNFVCHSPHRPSYYVRTELVPWRRRTSSLLSPGTGLVSTQIAPVCLSRIRLPRRRLPLPLSVDPCRRVQRRVRIALRLLDPVQAGEHRLRPRRRRHHSSRQMPSVADGLRCNRPGMRDFNCALGVHRLAKQPYGVL